jgi:hypothetical protein
MGLRLRSYLIEPGPKTRNKEPSKVQNLWQRNH